MSKLSIEQRLEFLERQRDRFGGTYPCGHDRTIENTVWSTRGGGRPESKCRECANTRKKDYRARVAEDPARFRCGHPRSLDNLRKSGLQPNGEPKVKCRICALARDNKTWVEPLAPELPASEEWALRGACRSSDLHPDTWFIQTEMQVWRARKVCKKCPVRQLCLAAGAKEPFGVWGGADERQWTKFRTGKISFEELDRLAAA